MEQGLRPGGAKYNDYLFKNIIFRVAARLFSWLLNVKVLNVSEARFDEEQTLLVGRPDLLLWLDMENGERRLVQFDHQTRDEPGLGEKLSRHFLALLKRFNAAPVQFVGFMDDSADKYARGAVISAPTGSGLALTFHAFNFSKTPAELFLDENDPYSLAFALLCDLRGVGGDERLVELARRMAPKMDEEVRAFFFLALQQAFKKQRISLKTMMNMTNYYERFLRRSLLRRRP